MAWCLIKHGENIPFYEDLNPTVTYSSSRANGIIKWQKIVFRNFLLVVGSFVIKKK